MLSIVMGDCFMPSEDKWKLGPFVYVWLVISTLLNINDAGYAAAGNYHSQTANLLPTQVSEGQLAGDTECITPQDRLPKPGPVEVYELDRVLSGEISKVTSWKDGNWGRKEIILYLYWFILLGVILFLIFLNWQLKKAGVWK
jgi:hypothetical protein